MISPPHTPNASAKSKRSTRACLLIMAMFLASCRALDAAPRLADRAASDATFKQRLEELAAKCDELKLVEQAR